MVLNVVPSAALLIHVEGMAPAHTTVLVMPIPVLVTRSPASVNAIASALVNVRVLDLDMLDRYLILYQATDDGVAAPAQEPYSERLAQGDHASVKLPIANAIPIYAVSAVLVMLTNIPAAMFPCNGVTGRGLRFVNRRGDSARSFLNQRWEVNW